MALAFSIALQPKPGFGGRMVVFDMRFDIKTTTMSTSSSISTRTTTTATTTTTKSSSTLEPEPRPMGRKEMSLF